MFHPPRDDQHRLAREYGNPAVAGIFGATRLLHEGQRVRVDSEAGQVVPPD
ncbi:MAG: PEP-utilizing enzyme [Bacillota bacterium]